MSDADFCNLDTTDFGRVRLGGMSPSLPTTVAKRVRPSETSPSETSPPLPTAEVARVRPCGG